MPVPANGTTAREFKNESAACHLRVEVVVWLQFWWRICGPALRAEVSASRLHKDLISWTHLTSLGFTWTDEAITIFPLPTYTNVRSICDESPLNPSFSPDEGEGVCRTDEGEFESV